MMKFRDSFKISRERFELFYSVFVLAIIPILFAVNTLLFTSSTKDDFDSELRYKAVAMNQVYGESVIDQLGEPQQLQNTLERVVNNNSDVVNLSINTVIDGDHALVASNNLDSANFGDTEFQYSLVERTGKSPSTLIEDSRIHDSPVWHVVSPIYDDAGELVAVSTIDVATDRANTSINQTYMQSFIVLSITIVVVILLLWNHFRFVERSRLVNKLKEADQLKSDFLSVATHELKAPTTVIKGYASNMIDGIQGEVSDRVKESLQEIINQADRLNGLVQDLLNVSRIEQGRISIELEPIDPSETISKVIKRYDKTANDKNISIEYKKPESPVSLIADQGRYEEVVTNLIDNAVKYSLKGTITVSHTVTDKIVKTSIRDTGIGMSAKERERLFSRFYRIQNDKTRSIRGTGLGLWIIKQYIEKMGGKIYVDSLEGEGTEFIVELKKAD